MVKINYPEYANHKSYHDQFVKDLSLLKTQLDNEGLKLNLVVQTNKLLVDWLINHIKKVDKALGEFLKNKSFT
jgi:hemerythrin